MAKAADLPSYYRITLPIHLIRSHYPNVPIPTIQSAEIENDMKRARKSDNMIIIIVIIVVIMILKDGPNFLRMISFVLYFFYFLFHAWLSMYSVTAPIVSY